MAALEARRRMEVPGQDVSAFESLFAPDLVVNSPINKVVTRENVLARMRSSQISYEDDAQVVIELAGVRGDAVVIMGEEIVKAL